MSPSVAAQADALSQRQFDRLLDDAMESDPAFGPEDGELEHDPDVVTTAYAEGEFADLVATATFQNPYAGSRQQFDYGIQLRSAEVKGEIQYLRFLVISTGSWAIVEGASDVLLNGTYDDLDVSRSGENTLTVYAEAELVHAAINGDYVGTAEVTVDDEGRTGVGTSYLGDSYRDGAVTEFTDFTLWEIGGSAAGKKGDTRTTDRSAPKPPSTRSDKSADKDKDDTGSDKDSGSKKDTDDKKDTGSKKPKGTTYESPKYGYTLTYDDSWELQSDNSAETIDALTLEDEVSKLEILGLPASQTPAECVNALVDFYASNLEEGGIDATFEQLGEGTIDEGNREGSDYVENMVTAETTEGSVVFLLYIECGPVDGSEYQVAVQHSIYTSDITIAYARRDAVVSTLAQAGAEPKDDPAKTDDKPKQDDDKPKQDDDKPKDNSANRGDNITEGEDGRLVYISPTYNFTVEILPDWTIEENSVQGGYDTLVVASATGRVTVSGFSSTGTAINCINSIITNLESDPSLSDVGIGVQPDGGPSRWDSDTTSEVVVFFTAGGVNYVRYYACFSGNDGQSMLVFAYEALEENIKTEFENIEQMLDLIRVP